MSGVAAAAAIIGAAAGAYGAYAQSRAAESQAVILPKTSNASASHRPSLLPPRASRLTAYW